MEIEAVENTVKEAAAKEKASRGPAGARMIFETMYLSGKDMRRQRPTMFQEQL
jgi:hypothetical protein